MVRATTVTGGLVRSCLFLSLLKAGFQYPDFAGDFYLTGKVAFPPGAVQSEDNLLVKSKNLPPPLSSPARGEDSLATSLPLEGGGVGGGEIPCKVDVLQRWPDGSILSAEVTFAANSSRKREYVISYGDEVNRRGKITRLAVLPSVAFSVGGVPKSTENLDIDVGQINVRVDRSPGIRYYWYLLPITAVIIFSFVRSRSSGKAL